MSESVTSTSSRASELRKGFQDEVSSFVPNAGQLVLDPNAYEGWNCTAYDANTDKSSEWLLQLAPLAPGVLVRGGDKKNYTSYTQKTNFWFSPKDASVPVLAANFLRAFRLDGKDSHEEVNPASLRLILEHTLVGAESYVTRATYDSETDDQKPQPLPEGQEALVKSVVAAYSICEPAAKKAE